MSFTGGQNYFQISLFSPKFRVNIPLVSETSLSEGSAVRLEFYKLLIFMITYSSFKAYQKISASNHAQRKKTLAQ